MAITPAERGLVTVFGGSGFLGRHVVRALLKRGWRVRAAVRRPDLAGHLQPLGMVGWVQPVQANLRYRWSVDRAVTGADAVINLVGVLGNSGRQRLESVNVFGARAVAEAARGAGIRTLVHVSALGADADGPSEYARSKAAGEAAVRETMPDAVVMRPSFVFGPEDGFFNRFAGLARFAPVFPVVGAATRVQPVFAGDVARVIVDSIEGKATPGAPYELGGPEVKTMRDCIAFALAAADRRRVLLPLPWPAASLLGAVLQYLPGRVITADQVRQLRVDNVVSEAAIRDRRTLAAFDVQPTSIEAIVPTYLVRFRPQGQFDRRRPA